MIAEEADRSRAKFTPNDPEKLTALTPEQKQFFDDNGYLVIENLIGDGEIKEFCRQAAQLLRNPEKAHPRIHMGTFADAATGGRKPHPDNPNFTHLVMDSPLIGDDWFNNIRDPRIVKVMIDLLGPNINFHNGKLRIKPPGYVNAQGWHQDWPYERHDRPELAACIIYLDSTRPGVGATSVLPGSHKHGELEHDADSGGKIPEVRLPDDMEPVELTAAAGSVAFIHVMAAHKAGHNPSDDNFTALINEYKTADTVATDDGVTRLAFYDMPLARDGQLF